MIRLSLWIDSLKRKSLNGGYEYIWTKVKVHQRQATLLSWNHTRWGPPVRPAVIIYILLHNMRHLYWSSKWLKVNSHKTGGSGSAAWTVPGPRYLPFSTRVTGHMQCPGRPVPLFRPRDGNSIDNRVWKCACSADQSPAMLKMLKKCKKMLKMFKKMLKKRSR